MATSGSLNTSSYSNRRLTFSWSVKSQSIEKNTTTISWTLMGSGSASGYYKTRNIKVTIDGKTVYSFGGGSDSYKKLYNGTTVASGTYTFTHETDGTRSFKAYVEAGIYVWAVNCTGSKTFTLDTIPRASTLTADNGTLDIEQTLTIKRAADSFKHRLIYACGTAGGYIAGSDTDYSSETSIDWTPPISLASQNTEGTTVSVKLTLYTYTGDGTHVGTTTKTITCAIPVSVIPSCTIAWEDTAGAADLYGSPVQGISKLKITVTGETIYNSPITIYSVTANGVKYAGAEVATDALKTAGQNKISATVKDKRGRSGSVAVYLDVLAYSKPVVSKLTVHRCDADGTENDQGNYVRVTFSAAISDLGGKNLAQYVLKYRPDSTTQYTEIEMTELASTYTVSNFSYLFPADANSTYDVVVTVTDNHGTATRATSASTAFTLINCHPSGTGMGVGKVSEKENTLEVGLDADFQGPTFGKVYGLSTLTAIPESSDINTYLTPGAFAVRSAAIAETLANLPVVHPGRLFVSASMGERETSENRTVYLEQKFMPYNYAACAYDSPAWIRYIRYRDGAYTYHAWFNEAIKAYPVGSIHLRYDHTDPATLFGGAWERIVGCIPHGAAASDTIGSTGSIDTGGAGGCTYINISVWRRTA